MSGEDDSDLSGLLVILETNLKYLQENNEGRDLYTSRLGLMQMDYLENMYSILCTKVNISNEVDEKLLQVINEFLKIDIGCNACAEIGMVPPLLDLLLSENKKTVELAMICLSGISDAGKAQKDIISHQGCPRMISLVKKWMQTAVENQQDARQLNQMIALIFNLCGVSDNFQMIMIDSGIIGIFKQIIDETKNDNCLMYTLMALHSLSQADISCQVLSKSPWLTAMVNLFSKDISDNVISENLRLICAVTAEDDAKMELVKIGGYDKIIAKIEQYVGDKEKEDIIATMCDFLSLYGSVAEVNAYLYDGGNGPIYKKYVSWLKSPHLNLQSSAIYTIGNFAQSNEECEHNIVTSSILTDIMKLLGQHNTSTGQTKVQHAAVGLLRNLAVSDEYKKKLIDAGIVDVIMPMVEVQTDQVLFQLLRLLCMLAEGNEQIAKTFGCNQDLVARVVQIYGGEFPGGVTGSCQLLLIAIVKYSKCDQACTNVIKYRGLQLIIDFLARKEDSLRNDAVQALNAICIHLKGNLKVFVDDMDVSKFAKLIHDIFQVPSTSTPTKTNTICLVKHLTCNSKLKSKMKKAGIKDDLKALAKVLEVQAAATEALKCF